MAQVRFFERELSWTTTECDFSIHGTSMLENNTHVSGDNKGVTSYLFEEAMKIDTTAAPGFVAAFSQSSVGDATPNVLGYVNVPFHLAQFERSDVPDHLRNHALAPLQIAFPPRV